MASRMIEPARDDLNRGLLRVENKLWEHPVLEAGANIAQAVSRINKVEDRMRFASTIHHLTESILESVTFSPNGDVQPLVQRIENMLAVVMVAARPDYITHPGSLENDVLSDPDGFFHAATPDNIAQGVKDIQELVGSFDKGTNTATLKLRKSNSDPAGGGCKVKLDIPED